MHCVSTYVAWLHFQGSTIWKSMVFLEGKTKAKASCTSPMISIRTIRLSDRTIPLACNPHRGGLTNRTFQSRSVAGRERPRIQELVQDNRAPPRRTTRPWRCDPSPSSSAAPPAPTALPSSLLPTPSPTARSRGRCSRPAVQPRAPAPSPRRGGEQGAGPLCRARPSVAAR